MLERCNNYPRLPGEKRGRETERDEYGGEDGWGSEERCVGTGREEEGKVGSSDQQGLAFNG